jgi:prepilin-type processing-associated H-X9-DG protein
VGRWVKADRLPLQDTPIPLGVFEIAKEASFGSAHAGAFNVAFCDGSVRSLSYDINPEVYRRLGNRKDGQTISAGDY